jgi:hypothetical protein
MSKNLPIASFTKFAHITHNDNKHGSRLNDPFSYAAASTHTSARTTATQRQCTHTSGTSITTRPYVRLLLTVLPITRPTTFSTSDYSLAAAIGRQRSTTTYLSKLHPHPSAITGGNRLHAFLHLSHVQIIIEMCFKSLRSNHFYSLRMWGSASRLSTASSSRTASPHSTLHRAPPCPPCRPAARASSSSHAGPPRTLQLPLLLAAQRPRTARQDPAAASAREVVGECATAPARSPQPRVAQQRSSAAAQQRSSAAAQQRSSAAAQQRSSAAAQQRSSAAAQQRSSVAAPPRARGGGRRRARARRRAARARL